MCARSWPFKLPWSPLTNRYIKLKQKFCKNNTHTVIHLGIFCSVYFLKKNASYSPLNWFHNPVMGPNPTGWKTQSKIISAQNNSKPSRGSFSKCCSSVPPRAGGQMMAPAAVCAWWRSTGQCSVCSLCGVSFQGPCWLCHKMAMGTDTLSVLRGGSLWSTPDAWQQDASSVSGVTGLCISSIRWGSSWRQSFQPLWASWCCSPGSVAQSCLTLWDPMDCSTPGSSVRGIFQARILQQVAISSSRASSLPRDQTYFSCVVCIGRCILYW